MSTPQRGDRGGGRGGRGRGDSNRGGPSNRGDFSGGRGGAPRGGGHNDRGGPSFRGDRGGGSFRGDRGGSFRGDRGGFQSDRGRGGGGAGRGGRGGFQLPIHSGPSFPNNSIFLEGNVPQPDKEVQALEDARVKNTAGKIIERFPGRPGHGTKGVPIVLRANYLHLKTAFENGKQEVPLYRYAVSTVGGEKLSKPKMRLLVINLIRDPMFADCQLATDYSSIVVTTKKLDLGPADRKQGKIEVVDPILPSFQGPDNAQAREARDRRTKGYELSKTGEFSLVDLVRALQASQAGAWFGGQGDVIQLLNIVISKAPNDTANVYSLGQNKYYPGVGSPLMEQVDITGGLQALRGYFASVRTSSNRILVNLNVASAAFYKAGPLMDLVSEFVGGYPGRILSSQDLIRAEGFIRMLRVTTNYLKALDANGKPKADAQGRPQTVPGLKSVVGLALHPRNGDATAVTFSWSDPKNPQAVARKISVFEFFKAQHGITLQHPKLPVLNVGTRSDPSYLPIELATVLPGQPVKRLLSGGQTEHMLRFAARAPRLNAESIAGTPGNGLKTMGFNGPAQVANNFGIEIGKELITVPGRILPTPKVYYGNKEVQAREGSWNLINTKFAKPGSFGKWACVVLNYNDQRGNALLPRGSQIQGADVSDDNGILAALERHLANYGVRMGARLQTRHINIPRPNEQHRQAIDAQLDETFTGAASNGIELLFIILKEADKWIYSRIKFWNDIKYGVQTVCAVGSKIQKPKGQDMYLGNLALKFNIKGGGVVHTQRDMHPLGNNDCMLVGIDVTHPSPGSAEGSPSIAGVVASVDEQLSQWPGSLRSQKGREEMVQGLTEMMIERLELWRKHNKKLPSKIIIFRDGVSEGQYNLVLDRELPPIQKAFEKLYGPRTPRVVLIVVGKRHHTRFYPTDNKSMDQKTGNPMPGTVVDRGVTSHYLWDFFLQAHKGLQGTARPAHYIVLKDELNFGQNELEAFVHKLCYNFNRATKAVSICPPAYYADLICERGRMYLYSTLNENQSVNGSAYNAQTADWTQGVHEKLTEKTFYI
ncbi:Piwi-domain-containing protein [Aureobasidium sp. EXF-10728]|nr:Piwi-domain-containing protein [Aureobasidium sp. EXF-10728]